MSARVRRAALALALGALVVAARGGPGTAVAEGVTAALQPNPMTVEPGAEFDLELWVTQAGASFNGFRAIVAYDTSALTLLPMSPLSQQVGQLMTGACGSSFHRFRPGPGVDTISVVLLCNGVSLTGPGQVYRLHFRAAQALQTTMVRLLPGELKFYDAGIFVNPVHSSDASIGIGMPPAAVDGAGTGGRLSLAVAPNPGRGRVVFSIGAAYPGPESLTVRDVQGRLVWKAVPGARQIAWDGRHELGHLVPNGTYFATLKAGGRETTVRFTLLR